MQAARRHWHGPQPAALPGKDGAVRVMGDSNLSFISSCHRNIIHKRLILATPRPPCSASCAVFSGQAVFSDVSRGLCQCDITLPAEPPPPPPSQVKGIILPQLLPSQELENFNFLGSGDRAKALMSITRALKQDLM